ncbi:MAG: DUF2062 domain-containing protein [Cyanobium sp.]
MAPFQPHTALGRRLRQLLAWLWHQEGSHGQRARGLAAGLFCGCYPFFGLQMVLSVALASLVRGNHLLAAAGTWVSNPFTYLPLYWFNYQIGCWLIGPGTGWPGLNSLMDGSIWHSSGAFVSRLMLGSTLMGLVMALLGGWLYWHWLEREMRRRRPNPGNTIR